MPAAAVHELIAAISEIDQFNGWWRGRNLSHFMTQHLQKRVVKVSALASTRIGAPPPAPRPFQAGRFAGREARDGATVTGYAEVLRAVFDGHSSMQFGPDLILQLHARLLRYSQKDQSHRGKYRTAFDQHRSYLHKKMEPLAFRSTDPDLTPRAMALAAEWATARIDSGAFHPLLVVAGFVLEFLAIRPFADGNGRLSRILTNLLLLRCGYAYVPYGSLEKVVAEHWSEYYVALRHSQASAHLPHPDITPWLSVFLETLRLHTRELRDVLGARPDDSVLSHNQLGVVHLLERHEELTNRLVCRELDLSRETAKQVLNRLVALNMLRRVGAGRAVRYRKVALQEVGAAAK